MNALTGANVLVEDKLFATLDPTTRKLRLPNNQNILLSDTVGFLRKLPHQLVESFKATLEEVAEADLLLHVVDVSTPARARADQGGRSRPARNRRVGETDGRGVEQDRQA